MLPVQRFFNFFHHRGVRGERVLPPTSAIIVQENFHRLAFDDFVVE
jgi:hypothetical protein